MFARYHRDKQMKFEMAKGVLSDWEWVSPDRTLAIPVWAHKSRRSVIGPPCSYATADLIKLGTPDSDRSCRSR